jgi:hypothetical protein
MNTVTESLNVRVEWNKSLMEEVIDVKVANVTSKEGSVDKRLWSGDMEPSSPDEKNIIGYEVSIQMATNRFFKGFDVTEEKARVKAFRNANLANLNCTNHNLSILKIVPVATCISYMTTSDMPPVKRQGSRTIVEIYGQVRQRISSNLLQQFRCNPGMDVALDHVLSYIATLPTEIKTKYPPGDPTYDHLMAILSLYRVPILA